MAARSSEGDDSVVGLGKGNTMRISTTTQGLCLHWNDEDIAMRVLRELQSVSGWQFNPLVNPTDHFVCISVHPVACSAVSTTPEF